MRTIGYAGLSDVGRVRTDNEDHWFADPLQGLYLVADGIGGAVAGGLAAQIVAEVLPPLLRRKLRATENLAAPETAQRVAAALVELSQQLHQKSQATQGLKGMGSTVVLALVHGLHAVVAHLGDSRAYLLHAGRLECLTKDHTLAQLLADRGQITSHELATHSARGQLTRFVGMGTESLPDARLVTLAPGDRLLLCSDGLSSMLSDPQIRDILSQQAAPETACRQLIAAANHAGGKDNITAVVLAVAHAPDDDSENPSPLAGEGQR
jgi:PPM family protein phosphatase